jgi:hypothetical protein
MIYITDNRELKSHFYTFSISVADIEKQAYTDIKDEKILEKLKNFGFKFYKLKFGEPISRKYYFDGNYFYDLVERRKI